MTRNKFPLLGLFLGLLLFSSFFGCVYFSLFRALGSVAPGSLTIGIVFALAFGIIGGAVEYHYRSPRE